MEKVEIFFRKEVEEFFNTLVFELYEKDYFSNLESAIEYKEKIIFFIKNSISLFPARKSPKKLQAFGNQYIFINLTNERLGLFSLKDLTRIF